MTKLQLERFSGLTVRFALGNRRIQHTMRYWTVDTISLRA